MTNESRAEVEITLDGKKWPMRPTFQAIREIEHATGMSAPRLLRQVMESDARVDHIARVVAIGVKAANDDAPATIRSATSSCVRA